MNGTTTFGGVWNYRNIFLGGYSSICFLLGFFGNVFALIASHAYKAIDLDNVTIVLIRNLAIADLMLVITTILPTLISIITGRWVFGDLLCDVTGHFNFIPVMVNIYLVLSLSIYKIFVCKNPFNVKDVQVKHAWAMVAVSYALSSIEFFEAVFLSKKGMWMPVVDRCLSMIYKTHPTLMMWNAYIPVGVPILVIIATNIWMFIIAARYSKSKGRKHYQAVLTVCAVSGIFVLSWTPKLIYVTVVSFTHQHVTWATLLSHYFPFINSVCNPIIYTITNRRYKAFVIKFFTSISKARLPRIMTSNEVPSFSNTRNIAPDKSFGRNSIDSYQPLNGNEPPESFSAAQDLSYA